jgi:hypothetical protein
MNTLPIYRIAIVCVLSALIGCSHGEPSSAGSSAPRTAGTSTASSSTNWIANGSTACEKYLTPDIVAAILTHPSGSSKKLSTQACAYTTTDFGGNIDITLMQVGTAGLDMDLKNLPDPVPLSGVGDKAVRTLLGIEAAKGNDRMCSINAGGAPGSTKLNGEALAQKLGEICNKLFALP